MFWRTLLTMVATTTMPYYYSISCDLRQDENGRNSLIVVHKSQDLVFKGLKGKQGVGCNEPITLLFNFQSR